MKAPEQIAAEIATRPAHEIEDVDLQELLIEAIEVDRAQLREHITWAIHDAGLPRDERNLERRAILTKAALEGWEASK